MNIDALIMSGATLASLCGSAATVDGDTDGMLFGQVDLKRTRKINDAEVEEVSDTLEAYLTGCCVCGSSLSFHSPSGVLNMPKLEEIASPWAEPVLGWFRFRRQAPMRPGLRETRVTRELLKLAESSWSRSPWNSLKQAEELGARVEPAVVFGLLCLTGDQSGGSVLDWQYSFWTMNRSGTFRPLPVRIRNLGDHIGSQHYRPLAPLPGVSIASGLVDAACRASEEGTEGVSHMYEGILGQLQRELVALRKQDLAVQNMLNQVQVKRAAIRSRQTQQAQGPSS